MFRTTAHILILCFLPCLLFSQSPFIKVYDEDGWEYGESVEQTSDGGFILLGGILNPATDTSYMYLVKTNALGDTVWTRMYGNRYITWGYSVQQTSDGGYILLGASTNNNLLDSTNYPLYMSLIKTNMLGDTMWTKDYLGTDGFSVQQTNDGGYILLGSKGTAMYLLKTGALGDTSWTKKFSNSWSVQGYSVQQTADTGYILVGTARTGVNDYAMYMLKTDSNGTSEWTKIFGSGNSYGHYVRQTIDGGYIACGSRLVKTNVSGDTSWTRNLSGYHSVEQTNDEGYILIGENGISISLTKTDTLGFASWTRIFDLNNSHSGRAVKQTVDGGYVLAGHTSILAGDKSAVLIKTDSSGNAPPYVTVSELAPDQVITRFYPNPTTGLITISGHSEDQVRVTVYNVLGELVMHQELSSLNEQTLDLSPFPNGLYFIHVESGQMTVSTKVIKQ